MAEATYFDGVHGSAQSVGVAVEGSELVVIHGDGRQSRYEAGRVRSDEPFQGLPRVIELPDGGIVHTNEAMRELFPRAKWSVMGIAGQWSSAFLCALVLVVTVVVLDQFVLSHAAEVVVGWVPESVDKKLGEAILEGADRSWLKPSKLPPERQKEIRERFEAATPGLDVLVTFRRTGVHGGFNAFALPGGTIVVLDGMAEDLTDDELMWVLGHEVGHTVRRDGMHGVAKAFGLAAVASTLWGDFSGWAAGVGAALPVHAHQRDAEREADKYMRSFAKRNRLPAQAEVTLWQKLKDVQEENGGDDMPDWLSTHPSTQERLEEATKAAKPAGS